MKQLFVWIWLIAVYTGLIAPFAVSAQRRTRGIPTPINMSIATPNGLQFRLSEGAEGGHRLSGGEGVSNGGRL